MLESQSYDLIDSLLITTYMEISVKHTPVCIFQCQEPPPDCWQFSQLEPLVDFVKRAASAGTFVPDPDIPIQVQPCRKTAELARLRALQRSP